ncbi:hypothetical protein C6341_g21768 [Phytophthora cactorum]|nr:hypothetical protein C6341_g21768 [Phytophthora cactorum]
MGLGQERGDNAPAHRAKLTKTCIKELNLKDLGHPAQSPDLNPIENVWAEMKRELNRKPATSVDDLKLVMKYWSSPLVPDHLMSTRAAFLTNLAYFFVFAAAPTLTNKY